MRKIYIPIALLVLMLSLSSPRYADASFLSFLSGLGNALSGNYNTNYNSPNTSVTSIGGTYAQTNSSQLASQVAAGLNNSNSLGGSMQAVVTSNSNGTYYVSIRPIDSNGNGTPYILPGAGLSPARGYFDSTNRASCSVQGWAYDPDNTATSIDVDVYQDGPAGSGTFLARCPTNTSRTDINTTFGISGNHGFDCVLPNTYIGNHPLYIHAIDINGTPNNQLSANGKWLDCDPAPIGEINFLGAVYKGLTNPNQNTICTTIDGWAEDASNRSQPVDVEVWVSSVSGSLGNNFTTLKAGSGSGNNGYNLPTPLQFKDGQTRYVTLIAQNIGRQGKALNRRLPSAYWTWYTFPTQASKTFPLTCPSVPPMVDLAGTMGTVANQVDGVAFDITSADVFNWGTKDADLPFTARLEFDFNPSSQVSFKNTGQVGTDDFFIDVQIASLAKAKNINAQFNGVTLTTRGQWAVRLVVDPYGKPKPNSVYEEQSTTGGVWANNVTKWQPFKVTKVAYVPECNDKFDNDDDNFIDTEDPGCHTDGDPSNPATFDPDDDSEGGIIDLPPPTLRIWSDATLIRFNGQATINYEITAAYAITCTVTGAGINETVNHTPGTTTGSEISNPLKNKQQFTLSCPGFTTATTRVIDSQESLTIEVVPQLQEV